MTIDSREVTSAKDHWRETAKDKVALAEALANLKPKDLRRLKRIPDLVQLIGILAEAAYLPNPFHHVRKPPTSVPK
jgi:hypothetical protein